MRFVVEFLVYVPEYQTSFITTTLQWLALINPWCNEENRSTAALEHCLGVISCAVALERPVTNLYIRNQSTTRSLFLKLQGVASKDWIDKDVMYLVRNTKEHPEFDNFVWSVFFSPGVARSIQMVLLHIHPRCSITNHWCHCMRMHTERPDVKPQLIVGMPNPLRHPMTTPMHRFLSNNARPGDMALVLDDLLCHDNFEMRRWVAATLGHKLDHTTIMALPWDVVVCCVFGNVMLFAAQSGFTELLPESQQDEIVSRLLRLGGAPQFASWFLRALTFHVDDAHLCNGCRAWWWKHGETVIPLLVDFGLVLLPCIPRLKNRCWKINAVGTESECVELAWPLFLFVTHNRVDTIQKKEQWDCLVLSLSAILPNAPRTMPSNIRLPRLEVFRGMFNSYESIWMLIRCSLAYRKWSFVLYFVKCDPSRWIQSVAMDDKLQPFADMIHILLVEPHPLPLHSQPGLEYNHCIRA